MPGVNPTGTNTAMRTSEVAMIGPVTSAMARWAASRASRVFSSSWRETFSTTTMASSTTRPMARTRPNMVSVLMEKPITCMSANVPIKDTGMVIAGIRVARQPCRNT